MTKANRKKKFRIFLALIIAIAIGIVLLVLTTQNETGVCFGVCGPQRISINSVGCNITSKTCKMLIANNGEIDFRADSCSFIQGGVSEPGMLANSTGGVATEIDIPGRASTYAFCSDTVGIQVTGSRALGLIQFSNGQSIPFSADWAES